MKKSIIVLATAFSMTLASFSSAEWLPLPTEGYWQRLLHLGADFYGDYLYQSTSDLLAAHGGEANQNPYHGLVYENLAGPGNGGSTNLTWTIMDNPTPINYPGIGAAKEWVWTTGVTANGNGKENYTKYWHINVFSPDKTNRLARLKYRCDDDIFIWNNGAQILDKIGWDDNNTLEKDFILEAGINSMTIKLREGGSGDHMGVRIIDRNGLPFDDLLYSLGSALGNVPAPEITALTHSSVALASAFGNITDSALSFYAVCDTNDWGFALGDWLASPTHIKTVYADVLVAPAALTVLGLAPNTEYFLRFFAVQDADESESVAVSFTTRGQLPVVVTLPETDNIDGLSATANGRLLWQGSDSATADVTLYWGEVDGGDVASAWDDGNPLHAPVTLYNRNSGDFHIAISNLWYSTEYHYRWKAVNAQGEQWSDETVRFTTEGEPWYEAVYAQIPAAGSIDVIAEIGSCGPGPATVSCWFGAVPGNLDEVQTWQNQAGSPTLTHSETGLQVGGTYYYAFRIECIVDANTAWTNWSDTLSVTASGATTWTAGAAPDDDWHVPGNWNYGVPGAGAIANFYRAGATVTATNDLSVASAVVNATGEMTFDLGAATLRVRDAFAVGGNPVAGYPAGGGAVLNLVSGTVDLGAGKTLTVGASGTGNRLNVIGANAHVIASNLKIDGSGNTFTLVNGAITNDTFTIAGSGNSSGDTANFINSVFAARNIEMGRGWGDGTCSLNLYGSVAEISENINSGSDMWVNPAGIFIMVSNSVLNVAKAIEFANNGNSKNGIFTIHRDADCESIVRTGGDFNIQGQNNTVLLNRGKLDVNGSLWFGTHGASNGKLIVNGGTVAVNGVVRYSNWGRSSNSNIELNGAESLLTASALEMNRFGDGNAITFNGGTAVFANAASFGNTVPHGMYGTSLRNRLVFNDSASRMESKSFDAKAETSIVFNIPDEGFAQTPVHIAEDASFDETTRFEITADAFNGTATLIEAGGIIPELTDEYFTVNIPKNKIYKIISREGASESPGGKIVIRISKEPSMLIIR